ncbi:MAG: hypothetical protein JWM38_2413 [Sphingomonas bacterium]|nr:hypothetical protein [Sphingomonas bacterium]MDB5684432.1 hypothetical protein [Sphingomonas bacterium]MDB5718986.1 hypothetical protein [Sphingomonas bacterium]
MTPLPEPSWRKPVGMIAILLLICVWSVLVASLAEPVGRLAWPLQALFYTIAGIAWIWILPLKRLLRWMELGRWS